MKKSTLILAGIALITSAALFSMVRASNFTVSGGGLTLPFSATGTSDVVQFTITDDPGTGSALMILEANGGADRFVVADTGAVGAIGDPVGTSSAFNMIGDEDTGIGSGGAGFLSTRSNGTEKFRVGTTLISVNPNAIDNDFEVRADNSAIMLFIEGDLSPHVIFGSTTDPGGQVNIIALQDDPLLIVQAETGQTNPIVTVEDDVGTDMMLVGPSGNVSTVTRTVDVDAATTFAALGNVVNLTCTGAESINTITSGLSGQWLFLVHEDTDCTIVDSDADTANTTDLLGAASNLVGAADLTLTLIYNGVYWLETSRSQN